MESGTGFKEFDDVAELLRKLFKGVVIKVTAGPWRPYDVDISGIEGGYAIDFYSPLRLGFGDFEGAVNYAIFAIAVDLSRKGKLSYDDVRKNFEGRFTEVFITRSKYEAETITNILNVEINRSCAGALQVRKGLWSVIVSNKYKSRCEEIIKKIKNRR